MKLGDSVSFIPNCYEVPAYVMEPQQAIVTKVLGPDLIHLVSFLPYTDSDGEPALAPCVWTNVPRQDAESPVNYRFAE